MEQLSGILLVIIQAGAVAVVPAIFMGMEYYQAYYAAWGIPNSMGPYTLEDVSYTGSIMLFIGILLIALTVGILVGYAKMALDVMSGLSKLLRFVVARVKRLRGRPKAAEIETPPVRHEQMDKSGAEEVPLAPFPARFWSSTGYLGLAALAILASTVLFAVFLAVGWWGEIWGSDRGRDHVLSAREVNLIAADGALVNAYGLSVDQVSDLGGGRILISGLKFLAEHENSLYLYPEINRTNCRPQQVFVLPVDQLVGFTLMQAPQTKQSCP
jgi:hypothetical protein